MQLLWGASLILATTISLVRVGQAPTPQTPTPLTLRAAVEIALQNQPGLASASANRQASEQRLKQRNASYFPTVTPSYTYQNQYNYGTTNQVQAGGDVTQAQSGRSTTTRQEQIAGSFRLWDTGTRDLNARQARQNLRSSQSGEENTRQSTIVTVASNYFSVLRTAALVKVSESQITRAENALKVVQAQVKAGVSAQKDIYQAEADLLNAQVNLLQAQNNYEVAVAQFYNALGITDDRPFILADVSAPTADTPLAIPADVFGDASSNEARIKRLVTVALEKRPDIRQSIHSVESGATSVRLAKVDAGPVVTADVSGGYLFDATNNPLNTNGNNRLINVGLTYPLFDGGSARANVHTNEATLRSTEAQLEVLRQQVAVEVKQAYRTLTQSRASVPAAESAQRAAQINYDAALASQREGAGTIVDVITAQTQLVQAQTNYVQAIFTFYTADAQLARAIGYADRIGTNLPTGGKEQTP